MVMTNRRVIAVLAIAVALGGCRGGRDGEAQAAVHVDSARAIPQALAEFRRSLPETRELGGAFATRRDSLVARFVAALERADTAAFVPMTMNRAEFAWLYYETDPQVRPPYELPPDLMWMQTMAQGEKGISRALRRFGGRPLGFRGYACARVDVRGPNRVWTQCRLEVAGRDGARVKARLFGGIIERGGRFKLFSYANEL
jgi:hypothetical protein